jgi:hypothetical protein
MLTHCATCRCTPSVPSADDPEWMRLMVACAESDAELERIFAQADELLARASAKLAGSPFAPVERSYYYAPAENSHAE